jgi:hypothetical protein
LFGEAQGRVIVSTANSDAVLRTAKAHGVPARVIGHVTGATDGLKISTGNTTLSAAVPTLVDAFHEAIPRAMSRGPA